MGYCTGLEDLNLFNNVELYCPPPDIVVGGCNKAREREDYLLTPSWSEPTLPS